MPYLAGIALGSSERQFGPRHGGPINLKDAGLQDALLRFAGLTAADLEAADLSGADLMHARLDQANLAAANLSNSCLDFADLGGANLTGLNLRGASLRFTSLSAADLEAADLSGANLMHARLDQANLRAANLHHACLDYADFAGADLTKVDLCGASLHNAKNLTPAQLQGGIGDESTILPPQLRGSVSWSPPSIGRDSRDRGPRAQPIAGGLVARLHSVRQPGWIALLLIGGALVGAGLIQQMPLSPSGLKAGWHQFFSEALLPVPQTAPEAPMQRVAIAEFQPSAGTPIVLAREGLTELAEQHPALREVRLVAAPDELSKPALTRIDSGETFTGSVRPALVSPAFPLRPAMTPSISTPSELHDAVLPALPPNLKSPAPTFVLAALEPVPAPVLKATAMPVALAALPLSAMRRELLTALPPVAAIALTSVRERARPHQAKAQNATAPAGTEPMMLSVSLEHQTIDVYRGTTLVTSSKVSSGMPGHATKTGVFSILEKQTFHHSNIYSGAPMPWMQRLTRSGTALHGGVVPGYPASHGCIRLPFAFAPKLFQMTNVGENVIVANARIVPKLIEHPNLSQPLPAAMASAVTHEAGIPRLRSRDATGLATKDAALPVLLAEAAGASIDLLPVAELVAADRLERGPGTGKSASSQANDGGDAPLRILVTRRTERDQMIGVQTLLAAMGYLKPQNFDGTFGKATLAAIVAFQKANGLNANGAFTDELVKILYKVAGKSTPPEGRMFVRQGFFRLLDAPVAFRQPDQPLGTQIYVALGAMPGDGKMRWMAMSLGGGTAAAALDRIEIPEDVRQTIAERLTPGASLIVADASIDSAILPEGDDFMVWGNDTDANIVEESPPQDPKQANVKRPKPRQAAGSPARNMRRPSEADYGFPPRMGRPGLFSRW